MSVVCAIWNSPRGFRALVLTGRWLSGTSTWPRKSSLVCQTENKLTSEKQKIININLVTMRQKERWLSTTILGITSFYPLIVARYLLFQFIYSFPVTLQTGSWAQGSRGGADTILAGGKAPKPAQSPPKPWEAPGGFLLMGNRSKPSFLDWQCHTHPRWEQLTPTGRVPAFGFSLGLLPTKAKHGNVGIRTKDTSGRWVSAVGPRLCAWGTPGIHSDRNSQDQTQPLPRERSFSQICLWHQISAPVIPK